MVTTTMTQCHADMCNLEGMKSVRIWLQTKFGSSDTLPKSGSDVTGGSKKMATAITPTTIRQFVIPKRKEGMFVRTGSTRSDDADLLLSASDTNNNQRKPYRKVASLPGSMSQLGMGVEDNDAISEPGYNAAVSLSHLRTKTSYGFTTVVEYPHTHRKESLLMGPLGADKIQLFNEMVQKESGFGKAQSNGRSISLMGRRSDPIAISRRNHSNPNVLYHSLPSDDLYTRLYQRRRSSVISDMPTSENQFEITKKSSVSSVQYLTKVEAQEVAILGELKFSLVYHKSSQQLHLTIIKAENLMNQSRDIDCSSYVKCYLEPGKGGKQQTEVVRCNKDPVYDSILVFKNISKSDLKNSSLRLRVCNKIGSGVSLYNKRSTIGEVILSLNQLGLESGEEVRIWRDLENPKDPQAAGFLSMTFALDPKEGQFYVTIVEASNLNRASPPDTYVKICVTQNGRAAVTKQTQTRKGSVNPTYNETFAFSISSMLEDLQSLSINMKVMSKERVRNDSVTGDVIIASSSSLNRVGRENGDSFWSCLLNAPNQHVNHWAEIVCSSKW